MVTTDPHGADKNRLREKVRKLGGEESMRRIKEFCAEDPHGAECELVTLPSRTEADAEKPYACTCGPKRRMFKVTHVPSEGGWCVFKTAAEAIDSELTDAAVGTAIRIEVVEMTDAEFDALPEFQGW